MVGVIIYDYVKRAIEKEITRAIEKYPQLEGEQDDIYTDMIKLYATTGEVAEVVINKPSANKALYPKA